VETDSEQPRHAMEQYRRRTEEQIALCKESIRQSKQLIDLSESWLSAFYASRRSESGPADQVRIQEHGYFKLHDG
jgi:hypothetical protein